MPKITVLMPVYNGEKYLRSAIESILNQTYKDFEFLIINDGSTDESERIILSYSDDRIRYVKNERNLRLIKTVNKGITLAKGLYIARMDCDDISLPNRFEEQMQALEKDPTLDGVSGRSYDLYYDLSIKRNLRFLPLHFDAFRFTSLFEVSYIHPCLMIKTEVLRNEPFKDDDAALNVEDFELGCRLVQKGYKIENLDSFQIYYRKNLEGVCFTHRDEQKEKSYIIAKNNLAAVLNFELTANFYSLLTEKKGFDSFGKLRFAIHNLNVLVHSFLAKYNISNNSKSDIKSWMRIRKFSFYVSALKEIPVPFKFVVLFYLVSKLGYCLDKRFVEAIKIWLADWSPFSKIKYLKDEK